MLRFHTTLGNTNHPNLPIAESPRMQTERWPWPQPGFLKCPAPLSKHTMIATVPFFARLMSIGGRAGVYLTTACIVVSCNAPEFVARPFDLSTTSGGDSSSSVDAQNEAFGCTPGVVQPCFETREGVTVFFPDGIAQSSSCRPGEKTCSEHGSWGPCLGLVAPKPRDGCVFAGDDANCNGKMNEGCPCIPGQEQPCGTDEGECRKGVQKCIHGRWSQKCFYEVKPEKEVCDGLGKDEDCDGHSDIEDSDCGCLDGEHELCGLDAGPDECKDKDGLKCGNCGRGVRICHDGEFTECRPRFEATRESCGAPMEDRWGEGSPDEDCDGKEDEYDIGELPPRFCTHYMVDRDKDRWGKIGPSFASGNKKEATHGCFCELPEELKDRGFVVAPALSRVNKDCADDPQYSGDRVHPGHHSRFYQWPSLALENRVPAWPHGSFDYNCSRYLEKKYSGTKYLDCVYHPGKDKCVWSENHSFWKQGQTTPPCDTSVEVPSCKYNPANPPAERCYVDQEDTYKIGIQCR